MGGGTQEVNHERRVDVLYLVDSVLQAINASAPAATDGPDASVLTPPNRTLKDSLAAALSRCRRRTSPPLSPALDGQPKGVADA